MAKVLPEEALTFDDVLLLPQYSEVTPDMVDTSLTLAPGLRLNIPVLSAAMDTVTEKDLAIALAKVGGMGIIHKNMTIAAQAAQIEKTKEEKVDLAEFPKAAVDGKGRLLVGGALGITSDMMERAKALIEVGVDMVGLDSAHGYTLNVMKALKSLRERFPKLVIMVGNVATYEGAKALATNGASVVKVGMGPGSICTTRIISGMGVPQLSAVLACAKVTAETGIPVVADGGIRYSGDVTKALAAGAKAVMIGSLFAQTEEAPGKVVIIAGKKYKAYRGMGSIEAMDQAHGSSDRYFQAGHKKLVAEGVSGYVPLKGNVSAVAFQLMGGLRSGMGYLGAKDLTELNDKAVFIKITNNGILESHPHDVKVLHDEPNYDGIK